jgi:hypothetical protein
MKGTFFVFGAALATAVSLSAELRVPAFTAYLEPDVNGARVSTNGIRGWTDPKLKVLWFGEIKTAATIDRPAAGGFQSIAPIKKRAQSSRARLMISRRAIPPASHGRSAECR